MIDAAISILAPHACVSCNKTGSLLCPGCTTDLIESRVPICIGCGKPSQNGICSACEPDWPVSRALLFGDRAGVLKILIDEYKFSHKRAASRELASLLGTLLPYASDAVIVPVPTIGRHIRERGYDHMALLARRVARRNHLRYAPLLVRDTDTVQHGASKHDRLAQAAEAFAATGPVDSGRVYIVIDDITTTGASLKAAARVLRSAGARHIWVAALARQPLE